MVPLTPYLQRIYILIEWVMILHFNFIMAQIRLFRRRIGFSCGGSVLYDYFIVWWSGSLYWTRTSYLFRDLYYRTSYLFRDLYYVLFIYLLRKSVCSRELRLLVVFSQMILYVPIHTERCNCSVVWTAVYMSCLWKVN